MEWIYRELEKCKLLFEKFDLRDIERNAVRKYFEDLNKLKIDLT